MAGVGSSSSSSAQSPTFSFALTPASTNELGLLAEQIRELQHSVLKINEEQRKLRELLEKKNKKQKRSRSRSPSSPPVATAAEKKQVLCVGCGRAVEVADDQCIYCGGAGIAHSKKSASSSSGSPVYAPVIASKQHTNSFVTVTKKGDGTKYNNVVLIHGSHGIWLYGEHVFTKSLLGQDKVKYIITNLLNGVESVEFPSMITLAARGMDLAHLDEAKTWLSREYPNAVVDWCVHPTILAILLAQDTPKMRLLPASSLPQSE